MLKGLGDYMGPLKLEDSDGWGPWEVNPTVVLNADADYGGDGRIDRHSDAVRINPTTSDTRDP